MPLESFSIKSRRRAELPALAFDLGGTWYRSGLVNGTNDVRLLDKSPAKTIWNCGSFDAALEELIRYLLITATKVHEKLEIRHAAVSIGAATNMITGRIIGGSPLWGSYTCDIDLADILSKALPQVSWTIVNDVTALAMYLLATVDPHEHTHVTALTVSTGIACRTIELKTGRITVDSETGLQGEVGHLPVDAFWRGQRLEATCDCGQLNHVSSFASGSAIKGLLERLAIFSAPNVAPYSRPDFDGAIREDAVRTFTGAVTRGDPIAKEFLDFITLPIAKVLLYQFAVSPQVTLTRITGGVAEGLGRPYLDSVIDNLRLIGLYGLSPDNDSYFQRRLGCGSPDGLDGMRGAAFSLRRAIFHE